VEGIPQSYIIQQIYAYCKRPVYKKYQGNYNAECCICHEGESSGKKRRLFYFPQEKYFYCFNCNRSWKEINWLQEVTKKTYHEILREVEVSSSQVTDLELKLDTVSTNAPLTLSTLPDDSIDICDNIQCDFYKDTDVYNLIQVAKKYCKDRRLFTAVNRPKSFYVTNTDKIHKNRLIIPFYAHDNKIECYQSRSLFDEQIPKYLTKYGEKCLYGENNIDEKIPYIFIFEGPIDAMFVKNGVGMGGASMTEKQENALNKCFGQEHIFVYDNDKDNKQMNKRIKRVIDNNNKVFIWPKEFRKYKDINEICTSLQLDEFPWKYIVQNSFSGIEAVTRKALK
jgi:predicted Fe-S protein YdhL (DUF1289 family)